jgi:hypothetical protein
MFCPADPATPIGLRKYILFRIIQIGPGIYDRGLSCCDIIPLKSATIQGRGRVQPKSAAHAFGKMIEEVAAQ